MNFQVPHRNLTISRVRTEVIKAAFTQLYFCPHYAPEQLKQPGLTFLVKIP